MEPGAKGARGLRASKSQDEMATRPLEAWDPNKSEGSRNRESEDAQGPPPPSRGLAATELALTPGTAAVITVAAVR